MIWFRAFSGALKMLLAIAGVMITLVFMSNGTANCSRHWLQPNHVTCTAAVTFNTN